MAKKKPIPPNKFAFIKKKLTIDGTPLPDHSVGIVEHLESDKAVIRFVWFDVPVNVLNGDWEYIPDEVGDALPFKICNVCHRLLSSDKFSFNQTQTKGRRIKRPSCLECRKIIDGVQAKTKDKQEWNKIKPCYELFTCPICHKRTIPELTSNVVLDHNHEDGRIRGWICESCNTGIGRFKDSVILLQNAISYLQEQAKNSQ